MSDEFVLNSAVFSTENSTLREALRGKEGNLRVELWALLGSEDLWAFAWAALSILAHPDDLERLSKDPRAMKEQGLLLLLGSFFRPSTDRQWELLRMGAVQEWEHPETEKSALRTLRMMEGERADQILDEALRSNEWMEDEIRRAMEYRRAWRRPVRGRDLERLLQDVQIGLRPEMEFERFGVFRAEDGSSALGVFGIASNYGETKYEATFRFAGGIWELRGLQHVHEAHRLPARRPGG